MPDAGTLVLEQCGVILNRTRRRRSATRRRRELEAYLTGTSEARPSDAELRDASVAGHAFVRPPDGADVASLRSAFLATSARHVAVRSELARLLSRLASDGVQALAFKGFHLAEFVYDTPGRRSYADVDLLVRPDRLDAICRAAAGLGWTVAWRLGEPDRLDAERGPRYRGHEVGQLRHPTLGVTVDLHRRIVHNNHNRMRAGTAPRRLTAWAWRTACSETLDGAPLLVPGPVDTILFGLVLNRCWGSDAWQVKPRDYLDFAAVIERYGVARAEILARARKLGVHRTTRIYLSRCDPYRRHLRLEPPAWATVRAWNLAVVPERGPYDAHQLVRGGLDLLRGAWTMARLLPLVRKVRRELAAHGGVDATLDPLPVAQRRVRPVGGDAWVELRRGAHRCLRLLRVRGREHDAVLAWSLRHALRRRGHDAEVTLEARSSGRSVCVLRVDGRALDMGGYVAAADRPAAPPTPELVGTETRS